MATVFGIALSVAGAYLATRFNNIMDMLQARLAFVNAPLFATFLLGMSGNARPAWRLQRVALGNSAAAIHHGLTLSEGAIPASRAGGWQ